MHRSVSVRRSWMISRSLRPHERRCVDVLVDLSSGRAARPQSDRAPRLQLSSDESL